jgi:uncharacterized membrane protein YqjE
VSEPHDETRSLFQRFAALRSTLALHLDARIQLLKLEAEEASRLLATRAGILIAALFALGFGYLLLLAGGVALLARGLNRPWWEVSLCAGVLHFGLGLALILLGRRPLTDKLFLDSRKELAKDRQWLTRNP